MADPYFASLANVEREPSRHPISKLEFEFERRKLTKDDVRELIYREVQSNSSSFLLCVNNKIFSFSRLIIMKCKQILEYHPQMLQEYMKGGEQISFLYPRWSLALIFLSFISFKFDVTKMNIWLCSSKLAWCTIYFFAPTKLPSPNTLVGKANLLSIVVICFAVLS